MTALHASRLARQALDYLLVGGLAAVVNIGLFDWLVRRVDGVLLPAITSFMAAMMNLLLSSLWLYRRQ